VGIAGAVVSWWGRPGASAGDSQGVVTDGALAAALDAAAAAGVSVAFHLEPYAGRDAASIRADLVYLSEKYGSHPALARDATGRPVYWVYDSYHIAPGEWERLLTPAGDLTVRGTPADGAFLGLWLAQHHGMDLVVGGFDGAYTYFATDGFSYGASTSNWRAMGEFLHSRGLAFVPCVAPGYDDTKIRPWNAAQRRSREGGAYYARMWKAALAADSDGVGVTSFNEWGEGTQIEPAVPRTVDVDALASAGGALPREVRDALRVSDGYDDYSSAGPPEYYLGETHRYAEMFAGRGLHGEDAPVGGAHGDEL
jgi:glycoprotein endo-alpha-1,2-mannosidase